MLLDDFQTDLQNICNDNLHFFSVTSAFRMSATELAESISSAVGMRLCSVLEAAANELELWSKTCLSQLDEQLRERKQRFVTRRNTLERIQQAGTELAARAEELQLQLHAQTNDMQTLQTMQQTLLKASDPLIGKVEIDESQISTTATA